MIVNPTGTSARVSQVLKATTMTESEGSAGDPSSAESSSPESSKAGSSKSGYEPPSSPAAEASSSPVLAFRFRRVVVAAILAWLGMAVAQWWAPSFDHQNANFLCIFFGSLLFLFTAYEAHRAVHSRGFSWRVPMACVGMIAALLVCFRVEGFTGEMVPIMKFRFAPEDRMEWKEAVVKSAPAQNGSAESDAEAVADSSTPPAISDASTSTSTGAIAAADSPQFLGANRNGVMAKRLFAVPRDESSVKVLWNQGIGEGWASFAVAGDRAVTLEQRDDQECVTCYRLLDGELLWIQQHTARHEHALGGAGPRSTPTIWKGRVYANGATGFLRCIDLQSGDMLWEKDLLKEAGWNQIESEVAAVWGHASSPLVIDSLGICVLSFGGPVDSTAADADGMTETAKSLIALDLETGKVRWKAGKDQFAYASPMLMKVADRDQIVSVNEKTVTGHQPDTGKTLWSFSWPGQSNGGANCAAPMPAGNGRFLVGKGYGGGSALVQINQNKGGWEAEEIWWSSRTLRTKFNHSLIVGDDVFGLDNGSLQAADLATGDSYWVQPRRSRFGQGQILQVDDTLVVQSEPGDVVFVAADTNKFHELGRLDALDSKTWNIPTVAGRHLLVRNDRQVICYLLPEKKGE